MKPPSIPKSRSPAQPHSAVESNSSQPIDSTAALKINNAAQSIYVLETTSLSLPEKQQAQVMKVVDIRNTESKDIGKYLKNKILEDEGEFNIACFPSDLALEMKLDFQFIISINPDKKMLIFETQFGDKKAPFTATDAFEFTFNHAIENTPVENDLTMMKIQDISWADNKNLAKNLEKIRSTNLDTKEKILLMEKELFTGDHSGKFTFRCLSRINYAPIIGSLKIDLSKPIASGDDLIFSIKAIN